jgi:hypothetical protein
VAVGIVAGLLLLVLPGGLAPVVLIVAGLLAGWVLPQRPTAAAALFLGPTAVVGAVRVIAEDGAPSVGALALSLVFAVLVVAVLTHVGAGLALRRRPELR